MRLSLETLRASLPVEGLFAEKSFLFSPQPYVIDAATTDMLQRLGHWLLVFQRACNDLYFRSFTGKAPQWIARTLDAGKPAALLDFARRKETRSELPGVIRPDLLVTPGGFAITELDSVPGGIGLTGWLAQTYAAAGFDILGGATGMLDGFRRIIGPRADILVSKESATYRPEMAWLTRMARECDWRLQAAETYQPPADAVNAYRFFELFDLPNLPAATSMQEAIRAGTLRLTAPMKPWLEEKLWLAMLWLRPLRDFWRRELSERHFQSLLAMVPQSWILDPTPLPYHAVIPGLEIQTWEELAHFSQKQRDLVLKISGFSPQAWGSRGVTVGSDVPQQEWAHAVRVALEAHASQPRVLMRFAHTRVVEHPFFDPNTGEFRSMRGRVRMCPYYFVSEGQAKLGGALATIVPVDKKIVHGMSDAILTPVAVSAA